MTSPPADPALRAAFDALIVRRLRVGLTVIAASNLFFMLRDHLWTGARLSADLANLGGIGLIGLGLAALRRPLVARQPRRFALLAFVVFAVMRTVLGIHWQEPEPTTILLVLVAVGSGAIVPWGVGAQCAAVLLSGGGAALAQWWLGAPVDTVGEGAAALVALAASIVFAFELQRTHRHVLAENLQRARAERELATLNAELEERVRARSAELAAAAEARRADQARFEEILEHAPAAIHVKDLDGRYLLINQRAATAMRHAREAVIGRTPEELLGREVAAALRTNDRQVLASGGPLQIEEVLEGDDGPHTYLSVKFALRTADGTPTAVCGISTDITERKRAEAERRRADAALLAIIENTPDAIWSVDRSGRVVVTNSAARRSFEQRFGVRFDPATVARQIVAPLRADLDQLYGRALAGEHVDIEYRVGEGTDARQFLLSAHPIVEAGDVTGAAVFARDVTAFKRAEEQARAHQAELAHVLRLGTMGEMAAGLAHEINQPLGAIANFARGGVHRLHQGTSPDTLLPILESIAAEALRAGQIIRRLRELVRKEPTPRRATDLNQIVHDSLQLVRAGHHDVTLTLTLAPELPEVRCDAIQIEQVLINLLLNAIDAVRTVPPADRRIRVTTAAAAESVSVEVRDAGGGLPPPPADVFAPFFTTKSGGLGMGLSISRSIAEAHDGTLTAHAGEDGGSVFRLTLPTTAVDHRHAAARSA